MSFELTERDQGNVEYLKGLDAVRERSNQVYAKAERNQLTNFDLNFAQIPSIVDYIVDLIKSVYPDLSLIPPHGRLNHFGVNQVDRIAQLEREIKQLSGPQEDHLELSRRLVDLVVVSVLLDAGAGMSWKYTESDGSISNKSEGKSPFSNLFSGVNSCARLGGGLVGYV